MKHRDSAARGARDAPQAAMSCCCRHEGHTAATSAHEAADRRKPSWWIDLVMGQRTARVELRRLVQVRVGGVDVVRLDDLWEASHFGVRPYLLAFDFVAEDGFRLGDKLPAGVAGHELAAGYACVASRNLVWAPTPERPCFWRVKGVTQMVAIEPPTASASAR
jgi:hypothetical protein